MTVTSNVTFRAWFRLVALAGVMFGIASVAHAQTVDSFNPGANGEIIAAAIQPDGKIIVAGPFTALGASGTVPRARIGRLHPDGTIDATFDPGVSANGVMTSIAVQRDGKILVGGGFTTLGGAARQNIGRLNANGTIDAAFDPGTSGAGGVVNVILVQPDDKILVGGSFTAMTGVTRNRIGRLNADGTLDVAFDPGANGSVANLVLDGDRILVGGFFTALGGGTGVTQRLRLGRLESNGTLDPAFNPGVPSGSVQALAIQTDGKILVAGQFGSIGGGTGTTSRSNIARLNSDGTVDLPFSAGAGTLIRTMALQADGRILIGGLFTTATPSGGAAQVRNRLARFETDGALDASFDPGASATQVGGLVIQSDGRIVVVGSFTGLGGGTGTTARARIGRILNTTAPTQSLTVTGGTTVTWLRGGSLPEVSRVEFESATDGVTYSLLGAGVRVPGGWQITGLGLPANPALTVRARGYYGTGFNAASGSITEFIAPASGTNIVTNGNFSSGTTGWGTFSLPDASGMTSNVTDGVFQFYRTGTQAVVLQNTGVAVGTNTPITAQFSLGNTDGVRKRISVLVHDGDFSDLHVCTFWLPAGSPLQPYTIRTHTTKAWTNATISFYAASGGSGGFYQVDNVSLTVPAGVTTATICVDPTVPAPPGGAAEATLLTNGNFDTGSLAPWGTFGQISGAVTAGVFEFIKVAGTPAGVVLQNTGQAMVTNQILTTTFQLGNSSAVRKRVTVIVHDNDFSDLSACTFWLAPGQALATYTYRTFTTKAWTNATVSVYPATVGADQWIRLDNVTLQRTPGAALSGTLCIEPGGAVPDAPAPQPMWVGLQAAASRTASEPSLDSTDGWRTDGFELAGRVINASGAGIAWEAVATRRGRFVLERSEPIDLTEASSAKLGLRSWLSAVQSRAEIQVSTDGITWNTVQVVAPSDTWVPLEIDLAAYLGDTVFVRYVFYSVEPGAGEAPDTWRVEIEE